MSVKTVFGRYRGDDADLDLDASQLTESVWKEYILSNRNRTIQTQRSADRLVVIAISSCRGSRTMLKLNV